MKQNLIKITLTHFLMPKVIEVNTYIAILFARGSDVIGESGKYLLSVIIHM